MLLMLAEGDGAAEAESEELSAFVRVGFSDRVAVTRGLLESERLPVAEPLFAEEREPVRDCHAEAVRDARPEDDLETGEDAVGLPRAEPVLEDDTDLVPLAE